VKKRPVSKVVLDASALLAVLYREQKRAEVVSLYLEDALILSVNYCEVLTNAVERGIPLGEAREAISRFSFTIVPADEELAGITAGLRPLTRQHGLSLGDRFCLALAISRKAKVITTDSQWDKFDLGIKVVVIK
jgi:ribonuclease VapC